MSKLRTNFLTGALVVIPLILTFWVLYFIIDKLNLLLLEPIMNLLERFVSIANVDILVKLLIFLFLLAIFTLIGFATRIILLRNIFGFGERLLYKVPMISNVYRAIKDISFAFFSQKDSIFQKAVLIEYPRKGIYQLGFVISETKGEIRDKTNRSLLSIFVPTTPNPTSGMLVLVPEEDTIAMDMTVTEAMKMVVSAGALIPKTANPTPNTEQRKDVHPDDRGSAFKKKGFQRD